MTELHFDATAMPEATGVLAFDSEWYVREHSDVPSLIARGWYMDPLHHYVMAGCQEGRSPNPEFQENYYRSIYPDIAKAIDDQVFSCAFEHYLRHGRAEGRRTRPAARGVIVDLTRFGSGNAVVQERILLHLSTLFGRMADWDFWLLTGEAHYDALSRLDRFNVSRLCVDRIVGDRANRLRELPASLFLAPLGPSEHYDPDFRTITVLPEIEPVGSGGGKGAAALQRAIAVSEFVVVLTRADRMSAVAEWEADSDRVTLLHLPPSDGITDEQPLPMALRQMAGRAFIVADVTGSEASVEVVEAALSGIEGLPGEPWLVAVAAAGGEARLRRAAEPAGRLAILENPTPWTWRWLTENCSAFLATDRNAIVPGMLEDALSRGRPLICSLQSSSVPGPGDAAIRYDADDPATVAEVCRVVMAAPSEAARATGDAIRKAFPALGDSTIEEPLFGLIEGLGQAGRARGPTREVLLGLKDGNQIHASIWFAMPPSAASRSLVLEMAVPESYPEASVLVIAAAKGQPAVEDVIERGRSARIAVALPSTRVSGRLTVQARRPDGKIIKAQPNWPGIELRSAAVLASGFDLISSAGAAAAAGQGPEDPPDTDSVLSTLNAALDLAAPGLNALEAAVGAALAAKPGLRLTVPGLPSILRAVAPIALHLTRNQFLRPDLRYHGSNKDQASRQQYLRDRGFRVLTEPTFDWKYGPLIARLDADLHNDPQVIIVEAMLHHPLMRYLRERFPRAKLLVRSHNAEVLHRLHTHTASLVMERGSKLAWLDPREAYTRGRNVFDHWRYDVGAIELADHILSISEWETERYWPRIGPRNKVSTVPYFLPRDLIYDGQIPTPKPRRCVCLTSASPGPVIYDAVRNFVRLVDGLEDTGDWDFPVTGGLDDRHVVQSPRCRYVGRVENPIELMSEATSMALLSPYGYGFKTKVLDAISAGSYTLMPQELLDRHPLEVRPYCLPVDMTSPASFKAALERSEEPVPEGDPNEGLRRKAYAAMDAVLGLA